MILKNTLKFAAILTLGLFFSNSVSAQDPIDLLKKFDAAVNKYDRLQYVQTSKERLKKGLTDQDMDMWVQEGSVKKVHSIVRQPEAAKLWYRQGENKGKVVTHVAGLALPPLNKRFMANSQHPIYRAGFKRTRDIIMDTYKMRGDDPNITYKLNGSVTFDGRDCYSITIEDAAFSTTDYKVKAGDNLLKIAEAKAVAEQRIMELNGLTSYLSIKEGQTIKIPTSYFKKVITYLDKSTHLPLYIKVEDDKGLLAEYGHYKLDISGSFSDDVFYRNR